MNEWMKNISHILFFLLLSNKVIGLAIYNFWLIAVEAATEDISDRRIKASYRRDRNTQGCIGFVSRQKEG
jgi:hypothetical protein